MLFRQLFDSVSSTYTYLLASRKGGEALLIDPVLEHTDRYLKLLAELDVKLVKAVDTHCHADHAPALRVETTDPNHIISGCKPIGIGISPCRRHMHNIVGVTHRFTVTDSIGGGVLDRRSYRKTQLLRFRASNISQHGKRLLLTALLDCL